jgi:hypothetical protein
MQKLKNRREGESKPLLGWLSWPFTIAPIWDLLSLTLFLHSDSGPQQCWTIGCYHLSSNTTFIKYLLCALVSISGKWRNKYQSFWLIQGFHETKCLLCFTVLNTQSALGTYDWSSLTLSSVAWYIRSKSTNNCPSDDRFTSDQKSSNWLLSPSFPNFQHPNHDTAKD